MIRSEVYHSDRKQPDYFMDVCLFAYLPPHLRTTASSRTFTVPNENQM